MRLVVNRQEREVANTSTEGCKRSGTRALGRLVRRLLAVAILGSAVDVAVTASPVLAQADTQPPRVSSQSPAAGATGVSITINVTAAFSEPVQPASIVFVLRDAANAVVSASQSYNAAARIVTLNPVVDLQAGRSTRKLPSALLSAA